MRVIMVVSCTSGNLAQNPIGKSEWLNTGLNAKLPGTNTLAAYPVEYQCEYIFKAAMNAP